MDSDLYSYLIGAAPTDPQKQQAVADQLRRRRSFGELGSLTGDRVLQPFGNSMITDADQAAQQIQKTRQQDVDNAQTKSYEEGQLSHMGGVLKETVRKNNMDHVYQMLMAQAALEKADKANAQKIPKLRQGDIKDLQDISQDIGEFNNLEDFLKQGGKFGAVRAFAHPNPKTGVDEGGLALPGVRQVLNFGASQGIGTDEAKTSFAMKQRFDRLYNIGARNRLFGATLTANEKKSWDEANPSTRQTDEQIAQALPTMRKVFEHRLKNKAGGLIRENYDPDAVREYADLDNIGMDMPGSEAAPKQKRVKVDANGAPLGN